MKRSALFWATIASLCLWAMIYLACVSCSVPDRQVHAMTRHVVFVAR